MKNCLFTASRNGEHNKKNIEFLERLLVRDGFVLIESNIEPGMTHFKQRYYVSSTEPGKSVIVVELISHFLIEVISIKDDAEKLFKHYNDIMPDYFSNCSCSLCSSQV